MSIKKSNRGMAALLSVIIISAATVIMSLNASILSLGELEMGSNNNYGNTAYYIAEGCIEESIRRSIIDNKYETSGKVLDLGGGYCDVAVVGGGEDKVIDATGHYNVAEKRIVVDVTISSSTVVMNNWGEVDN